MKTLCMIVVCCLGADSPNAGDQLPATHNEAATRNEAIVRPANAFLSAPQTPGVAGEIPAAQVPSVQDAVINGDVHVGCACSYCQGYGGLDSSGWVGNPYTRCSSCQRDGTGIWPYDYRRAYDYPWDSPNYAWGSPFVPQAWWPEIQAMYGPDYPYSLNGVPQAGVPYSGMGTGDVITGHAIPGGVAIGPPGQYTPYVNPGELLPIASPPFPTPMPRKIIRID